MKIYSLDYKTALKIKNAEAIKNDFKNRSKVCTSMPRIIKIIDTTKCNLNCIMCYPNKNETIMDFNLFKKIAKNTFRYLWLVELTLAGEPFINPNFSRQLSIIEAYGVKLLISTNATLIPKGNPLMRLVNNLYMLWASIDAASKKTYEDIRRGAQFENVIDNIKRFNSSRKMLDKENRPKLGLRIVLMRRNIEELPEYVRLAASLEADYIAVCHLIVLHKKVESESLIHHRQLANRYLKQARDLINAFGIKIAEFPPLFNGTPSLVRKEADQLLDMPCSFLWKEAFIDLNGDVFPCCAPDRRGLWMGNISRQSFRQIWNGKFYQRLRTSFRDGNLYPACRDCYQRLKEYTSDNNRIYFPPPIT